MNDVKVGALTQVRERLSPGRAALLAAGVGLMGLLALTFLYSPPVQGAMTMDDHGAGLVCKSNTWSVSSLSDYWVETGDLHCADAMGVYVFPQEVELNHPLRYETCDGNWMTQTALTDHPHAGVGDLFCAGADGYSVIPAENQDALLRYPPMRATE